MNFVLYGSHYHFWFFPALIVAVIISTLFHRIRAYKGLVIISLLLYAIGAFGCSYHEVAIQIPVLSSLVGSTYFELIRRFLLMGLPFFVMGGALVGLAPRLKRLSSGWRGWLVLGATTLLFLLEIIIVVKFGLYENIVLTLMLYPLVGIIVMMLQARPMEKAVKLGDLSRGCAGFVYYVHPAVILFVEWLFALAFGREIGDTFLFVITTCISLCLGYLVTQFKLKERFFAIFEKKSQGKEEKI